MAHQYILLNKVYVYPSRYFSHKVTQKFRLKLNLNSTAFKLFPKKEKKKGIQVEILQYLPTVCQSKQLPHRHFG